MIEIERHGKRLWIYWDEEECRDAHEQWRQLYAEAVIYGGLRWG